LTFVRVRFFKTGPYPDHIIVPAQHKRIPVTRIRQLYHLLDLGKYAAECITIPSSVEVIFPGAVHPDVSDLEKVIFSDPYGWYVTKTKGASSGEFLDLTDPEQNAIYLGDTYREYYWYKTTD